MQLPQLKICEFNVENLFISLDYYAGEDLEKIGEAAWKAFALAQLQRQQKPLAKVWGVALAITEMDPDVVMLVEVGGAESLANLNRHFLGGRYDVYFVEGNSRRGIDLGYLVRRGLPISVEARSNRDYPVEIRTYRGNFPARFSRDVAELRIYGSGGLRLILLLVHLKSKISTEQDSQGKDARTGEAIAAFALYEERRAEFPDVPIILGGDFNAPLESLELAIFRQTDLQDLHEVRGSSPEERISLTYFDFAGTPFHQTLDHFLLSPEAVALVIPEKSGVYRYRSFHQVPEEKPTTLRERYQMPSDHYPYAVTLKWDEDREPKL